MERPTAPEQPADQTIPQEVAAQLAGVGVRQISRWRTSGRLSWQRTPTGRILVSVSDLSAIVGREIVPPASAEEKPTDARLSEIVSRLAQIVALAEEIGEERGRDRERAVAAERERDGALQMMRDLLSRAGITLQSTG